MQRRSRFTTTHWSVVRAAAGERSADAAEAMTLLCESYWYPLYAYLRGRGHGADEAQDLTQAFFARLLEKGSLRQADPARGRFRSFLLTSLQNFAVNEWERQTAQKRGGGTAILSLDFEQAEGRFQREPMTDDTPDKAFERLWALTVLNRALERQRTSFEASGKGNVFEHLSPYLTGDQPQLSYAETAAALGKSEGAVKTAVNRMRDQFAELVKDEIAQTVSSDEEMDEELRFFRDTLAR